MGLFLRQDGGRSELQTKVASDIRERMTQRTTLGGDNDDAVEVTPTPQKDTPHYSAIIWIIGAVVAVVIVVLFVAFN